MTRTTTTLLTLLFVIGLCRSSTAQPSEGKAPEATPAADKATPAKPTPAEPTPAPASAEKAGTAETNTTRETNCKDRIDNDGDGLYDCYDADCYKTAECKTAGGLENTNLLCSDGKDNDADGAADCEDVDCSRFGVTTCKGSWKGPLSGSGAASNGNTKPSSTIPQLGKGMTVEDLMGKGPDKDGERNDQVCSDGVDNDGDGMVDCQDYGCRFDPSVTVCHSHFAGVRFGVAAHIAHSYDFENELWDTRFARLQMRALGSIPGIQNSFFLLSMRAEKTMRLTFATFEVPIYKGHRININSGGGGLSNGLVLGTQKNILLDPAYYLYSAFEGGNGASLEVNGPIVMGLLEYRVFGAGGAGEFNGNVGGRFFRFDQFNYTYAFGAQLAWHAIGRFDRWDTRFLYTSMPTSLSVYLGGRYDQRALERFPAGNLSVLFRSGPVLFTVEGYVKKEIEFESTQISFNAQAGVLLIPKWLMLAGDFGMFYATEFDLPGGPDVQNLDRINDEMMGRAALHFYYYKNTGVLSLLFKHRFVENWQRTGVDRKETEMRLEAQYRF